MKRWWLLGFSLVIVGGLIIATGIGVSLAKTGEAIIEGKYHGGLWEKWIGPVIDDKTYIVLLQNNTELRPSGGFMGSYVRLRFEKEGLKEMLVKDIYEPDGQLAGHVEPPVPLQEAFGQGWWKLRDSNWEIDFPTAAGTINWFLEQGKEQPVDGIIAVNLDLVKKWIGVVEGVKPVTVEEDINEHNFYSIAQAKSEVDWYPGSSQKRDFLGAVGTALVEKTKMANSLQKGKLVWLFGNQLNNKQILVWMKEPMIQKALDKIGWSGKVEPSKAREDYLYIVESNLGANKANCCIRREVEQAINDSDGKITINWNNENKVSTPDKISNWGGDYYDYVRVVTHKDNRILGIKIDKRDLVEGKETATPSSLIKEKNIDAYRVEPRGDLQVIGFWTVVKAKESLKVEIVYKKTREYKFILVKRQPGIESFPYKLVINGRTRFNRTIDKDRVIGL